MEFFFILMIKQKKGHTVLFFILHMNLFLLPMLYVFNGFFMYETVLPNNFVILLLITIITNKWKCIVFANISSF